MRRKFLLMVIAVFAIGAIGMIVSGSSAPVADPLGQTTSAFVRGTVRDVLEEGERGDGDDRSWFRTLGVQIDNGGAMVEVRDEGSVGTDPILRVRRGDAVVIERVGDTYHLYDRARLRVLMGILAGFVVVAVIVGRSRAAAAFIGLVFSISVLLWYVVPRIAAGVSVMVTVLIGSVLILTVSLTLAHGFRRRTVVALVATFVTLGIAAVLASLAVAAAGFSGLGSEEAFFLAGGPLRNVDLRGLLLGGIVIGVLGILDDITTSQAAVVEELARANPALTRVELYRRGRSVGREHIAALVNTIALAYVGASLPLFLLFTSQRSTPLWVVVNSEAIAQEIVRTIVGSTALILAVPITTAIAAWMFQRSVRAMPASS